MLFTKASAIKDAPAGKLATLEAVIKKMPTRFKSDLPGIKPMFEKEESSNQLIKVILAKYPQHKRVLFLKAKYDNNELLSHNEIAELQRFEKLLK